MEHFNIDGHTLPDFGESFVYLSTHPLSLGEVEEALNDNVVMTIAETTNGMFQTVSLEK